MSRTKAEQRTQQRCNALVGSEVKFAYTPPAMSCGRHRMATYTGTVHRVRHNPLPGFGRNTLMISQYEGNLTCVRLHEVVAVKGPRGGWLRRRYKREDQP